VCDTTSLWGSMPAARAASHTRSASATKMRTRLTTRQPLRPPGSDFTLTAALTPYRHLTVSVILSHCINNNVRASPPFCHYIYPISLPFRPALPHHLSELYKNYTAVQVFLLSWVWVGLQYHNSKPCTQILFHVFFVAQDSLNNIIAKSRII